MDIEKKMEKNIGVWILIISLIITSVYAQECPGWVHIYNITPKFDCIEFVGGCEAPQVYVYNRCPEDLTITPILAEPTIIKANSESGYNWITSLDASDCIRNNCRKYENIDKNVYIGCANDCQDQHMNYTLFGKIGNTDIRIDGRILRYSQYQKNLFVRYLGTMILILKISALIYMLGLVFCYFTDRKLVYKYWLRSIFVLIAIVLIVKFLVH